MTSLIRRKRKATPKTFVIPEEVEAIGSGPLYNALEEEEAQENDQEEFDAATPMKRKAKLKRRRLQEDSKYSKSKDEQDNPYIQCPECLKYLTCPKYLQIHRLKVCILKGSPDKASSRSKHQHQIYCSIKKMKKMKKNEKDVEKKSRKLEPFGECPKCQKVLFSKKTLLAHQFFLCKLDIPQEELERNNIEVRSCDQCSARFWKACDLKRHQKQVHKMLID